LGFPRRGNSLARRNIVLDEFEDRFAREGKIILLGDEVLPLPEANDIASMWDREI
jgi:hypothetical protein